MCPRPAPKSNTRDRAVMRSVMSRKITAFVIRWEAEGISESDVVMAGRGYPAWKGVGIPWAEVASRTGPPGTTATAIHEASDGLHGGAHTGAVDHAIGWLATANRLSPVQTVLGCSLTGKLPRQARLPQGSKVIRSGHRVAIKRAEPPGARWLYGGFSGGLAGPHRGWILRSP